MATPVVIDLVENEDRVATIIRHLEDQRDVLKAQGWVLSFQNQALKDLGEQLVDTRKRLVLIEGKIEQLLRAVHGD